KQQEDDRHLLQNAFLSRSSVLKSRLGAIGLSQDVAAGFLKDLARPLQIFSVQEWLASPASHMMQSLWMGQMPRGWASAVLVGGSADSQVIEQALGSVPGARFFDQTEAYSNLFRRYRHLSMGLILMAYLGVWVLMMFRYGLKAGTGVTAPSVGS